MMRLHLLILMATIFYSTVAGCPPRNPQPIVHDIVGVEGTHGADVRFGEA
jgi:hypothetical protein